MTDAMQNLLSELERARSTARRAMVEISALATLDRNGKLHPDSFASYAKACPNQADRECLANAYSLMRDIAQEDCE